MVEATDASALTRVLIVEDNDGDARLLTEFLAEGELRADPVRVGTLEAALDALGGNSDGADVVVADLGLPDSEGAGTVRELRTAAPEVPLVVLTGRTDMGIATDALQAGASEYLRKDGLTPALLSRTIRLAVERHRLESEAQKLRELGRSILESLPEHIAVLDTEGTIVSANEAWRRFARTEGGDPRGYVGESYLEETRTAARRGSDDAKEMLRGLRSVLRGEAEQFEMEYPCHGPDERRWFRVSVVPLRGDERRGVVVSHINITERIRRQQELQTATGLLRERIKEQTCLHDVSQLLHTDGRDRDPRLQDLVDRLPEGWKYPDVTVARLELEGDSWRSRGFAETEWMLSAPVETGGETVGRVQVAYLEERPAEDVGPFLREEERLLGAIADQVSVAVERRRSRRRLEAERSRLSEIFENAEAFFATSRGPEHVFEMANPAYRELVGDREVVGRPVREALPELVGAGYFEMLDHVYRTGETVEGEEQPVEFAAPDSEGVDRRYLNFVFQPRREDGEVVGVIAHGMDVTELVEKREEAREAEEKWATAFALAPIGVAISDPETSEFYSVNRAFAEMFDSTPVEMVGSRAHDWGGWHDPGRREEILAQLREEGVVRNAVMRFVTTGGEVRIGELSVNALEVGGDERLIWIQRDITEERQRRERLHLLESAVESTRHGLIITDRDGAIVWANPAFEEMTGYGVDEVTGENPRILKSGEQDEDFYADMWETIVSGESWEGELVNRRKDGTLYVERQGIVPVRHQSDEITHFIALKQDITEERRREEALRESEARYRTLVETMAEATVILDPGGRIAFANAAAEELLGLGESEMSDRSYDDPAWLISKPDGSPFPPQKLPFRRVMATGRPVRNVEHAIERRDGERRVLAVNAAPLRDASGDLDGVVATMRDVTDRRQMEQELRHRALHDVLTGLANRSLFRDRLEQALARAEREDEPLGLLILDLDRFKQVNDHLGHAAGDRLLEEVAHRLEGRIRGEDTVARLGGDEFAVIAPSVGGQQGLTTLTDRLLDALRRPFSVGGEQIEMDVTVGGVLACGPESERSVTVDDPEDVVRYADLALYRAKDRSGPSYYLFDPGRDREYTEQLGREQEVRRAIREEEIEVHFQTIVRLSDGAIRGVEPLARWRHPDRGLLSPANFIPLAEETGLIHDLGDLVMRRLCEHVSSWPEDIRNSLRISPNVSGRQFDREDLADRLLQTVRDADLSPHQFDLEVTESAITRATGTVEELRAHGFGIFVDDFGTGYSSFHYLRDLHLDGLKIDMTFVHALSDGRKGRGLVETMITMGRSIEMTVVAEGIETEEQREILRDLGCPLGQGHLFTRPMSAEALQEHLVADGEYVARGRD